MYKKIFSFLIALAGIQYTFGQLAATTTQPVVIDQQDMVPNTTGYANGGLLMRTGNGGPSLSLGIRNTGNSSTHFGWLQTAYNNSPGVYGYLSLNPMGGNVGVGTMAPAYKLHVTGSVYSSGTLLSEIASNEGGALSLINSSKTGTNVSAWKIYNMTGAYGNSLKFWKYSADGTNTGAQLSLNDDGSSFFSGALGIGTVTPSGLLHLHATGATLHITTPNPSSTSSAAAFRGNNATWLLGYTGAAGAEELSIGTRDGTGTRTLLFAAGGSERMRILANGNVGIGTTTPGAKLSIAGNSATYQGADLSLSRSSTSTEVGKGATLQFNGTDEGNPNYNIIQSSTGGLQFFNFYGTNGSWQERMRMTSAGNLLIGKNAQTNTSYKLDVNGNIRANKLVVNTTGADFVFEGGYQLPSLDSVEKYINQHHHLPAIASAAEMQREGIEVGESQARLLQKIEELTLYVIAQKKEVTDQKMQIAEQRKMLEEQRTQIAELMQVIKKGFK